MFITLCTFTLTYAIPLPAQPVNVNVNEVAFMVRMEKLVEKIINSKDKSTERIISYFVDIKQEIETSYNIHINLDQYIDSVQYEIKKQGVMPDKKQLEIIKKMIKKKEKKVKDHRSYVASIMYLEDYQMNDLDEEMMFPTHLASTKDDDKTENKDGTEETVVPSLLVYGVTIALCGLFLMCLPIPTCKDWGGKMVVAGITACANSICPKNDENNKKNKDKK